MTHDLSVGEEQLFGTLATIDVIYRGEVRKWQEDSSETFVIIAETADAKKIEVVFAGPRISLAKDNLDVLAKALLGTHQSAEKISIPVSLEGVWRKRMWRKRDGSLGSTWQFHPGQWHHCDIEGKKRTFGRIPGTLKQEQEKAV